MIIRFIFGFFVFKRKIMKEFFINYLITSSVIILVFSLMLIRDNKNKKSEGE